MDHQQSLSWWAAAVPSYRSVLTQPPEPASGSREIISVQRHDVSWVNHLSDPLLLVKKYESISHLISVPLGRFSFHHKLNNPLVLFETVFSLLSVLCFLDEIITII